MGCHEARIGIVPSYNSERSDAGITSVGDGRLDELFTAWPFLGSRRMAAMLRMEGHRINRKRVQRLMHRMGIAALGPTPRTTKPAPGHRIFPYLLRGMVIDRPNQPPQQQPHAA